MKSKRTAILRRTLGKELAFLLLAGLPILGHAKTVVKDHPRGQLNISIDPKNIKSEPIHVLKNQTMNGDLVTTGPINVEGTVTGDCVALGGPVAISGKVLGDVIILGGPGDFSGQVTGDLASLGGPVNISGVVKGDVDSLGGNVVLGSHALVGGNVELFGGQLSKSEGATVKGSISNMNFHLFSRLLPLAQQYRRFPMNAPLNSNVYSYSHNFSPGTDRFFSPAFMVGIGLVVLLLAALLHKQTENIAGAIQEDFWKSTGIGLLILIFMVPGLLLMLISIIGILLIPLAALLYFVGGLMSLAAFSLVLTGKFYGSLKKPLPPTFLGVAIGYLLLNLLMIVGKLMEAAGSVGDIVGGILVFADWMLICCGLVVGFGAAWSTRLGSRKTTAVPAAADPIPEQH